MGDFQGPTVNLPGGHMFSYRKFYKKLVDFPVSLICSRHPHPARVSRDSECQFPLNQRGKNEDSIMSKLRKARQELNISPYFSIKKI
jgi:hypothetical protein